MLKIRKTFDGLRVSDPSSGNSNHFLQNILVEVVVENYKQIIHEHIFHEAQGVSLDYPDPPLRANERILAGLFGNAIASIAERCRPEVRIDKGNLIDQATQDLLTDNEDDPDDTERDRGQRPGRVDYLAWYSSRVFAIELKMAYMNCDSCETNEKLKKRWEKVVDQAISAQAWLRERSKEEPNRYPDPVSIALMVVIGKRKVTANSVSLIDDQIKAKEKAFLDALESNLSPKPQFLASYIFPSEFRQMSIRTKGKPTDGDGCIYTPFVAFLGRSSINKTSA